MNTTTSLSICGLELFVHLGWPAEERCEPQRILLDIDFTFQTAPHACVSDQLTDTFCYATLGAKLQSAFKTSAFHLIEHLAYRLHQFIQQEVGRQASIVVTVTKFPPLPGLTGAVKFQYGAA